METTIVKGDGVIVIHNPTAKLRSFLEDELAYENKSKKFMLKRKMKSKILTSPYFIGSKKKQDLIAEIEKLKKEIKGTLLTIAKENVLVIPSGLEYLLKGFNIPIIDKRTNDGGEKISLPWVKKPFDPRDYQEEGVILFVTEDRGIICLPMGCGKTLLAIHAIRRVGRKALIICPSDSVAKQFYEQCIEAFGQKKIGFIGGGKYKINDVTISIMHSVNNKIDDIKKEKWGLVLCDEAHHAPASTIFDSLTQLSHVKKIFGLSATPYRSDGLDILIHGHIGGIILERDIKWAIAQGILANPVFIIKRVNTEHLKDFGSDKNSNYKEHIMNKKTKDGKDIISKMNENIIYDMEYFLKKNKKILAIVDETEHGSFLANHFNCPFAQGEDKKSNDYVAQFNKEELPCLIGTDGKVGEGTDIKPVDVLITANFMASKSMVLQVLGRALRTTKTKKEVIILDYIPTGSEMLKRHAEQRIEYYKEITDNVFIINSKI